MGEIGSEMLLQYCLDTGDSASRMSDLGGGSPLRRIQQQTDHTSQPFWEGLFQSAGEKSGC